MLRYGYEGANKIKFEKRETLRKIIKSSPIYTLLIPRFELRTTVVITHGLAN